MPVSFTRRDVLRIGGLATMTTLSGCQFDNPETTAGHIYAENGTGSDQRLALALAEQSEETSNFETRAWYRLPAGTALEFEGVLAPNQRYSIRVRLAGAPPEDLVTATIDQCPEGQEGERVVIIDVQPDGMGIIPHDCETSYTQSELEYVPASEHRIESLDGRLTTTARGEGGG